VRFAGRTHWAIGGLAFSPDGTLLASASADETVRLWSPGTSKELCRFAGFSNDVLCVAFSPHGDLLAAASGQMALDTGNPFTRFVSKETGGEIIVWDVAARQKVASFQAGTNGVLALAFAPDGSLATASAERLVEIWDPRNGRRLASWKGFAGMTLEEAAEAMGISARTADNYWSHARAWLFREIKTAQKDR
jgi:WD40 repeat protein